MYSVVVNWVLNMLQEQRVRPLASDHGSYIDAHTGDPAQQAW